MWTEPEPGCGQGRIALVTGGNTGIGYAVCEQMAHLGFSVLLGARNRERGERAVSQLRADGLDVALQLIDIADDDSVNRAADDIGREHGRLDALVNNAAVKLEFSPQMASESSLDVVRATLGTNVVGTIAAIGAMLPLLRAAEAGRIVNVSSGLGSLAWQSDPKLPFQRVNLLGYCTSKTAINAVTVLFANELASSTIKVNCVDPGSVATPMNPRATRTAAESVGPILWLATLGPHGPNGTFWNADGPVPW